MGGDSLYVGCLKLELESYLPGMLKLRVRCCMCEVEETC